MKVIKYFSVLIFIGLIPTLNAKDINICSDLNYWYPFTFMKGGKLQGVHYEIVNRALKELGYNPHFIPLPWKRCLIKAGEGEYDAVLSASYKTDRAKTLHYPEDAVTAKKSKSRIMQVEYVVVSNKDEQYEFNGDIKTLIDPIRCILGYSISDYLKKNNIPISEYNNVKSNMQMLIKSKRGTVITTAQTAKYFLQHQEYKDKIRIHNIPLRSKSYFLPFSKKSDLVTKDEMKRIWENIAKIRDDSKYVYDLLSTYSK